MAMLNGKQILNNTVVPTKIKTSGYTPTVPGDLTTKVYVDAIIPSQTGFNGAVLTTNGTVLSWIFPSTAVWVLGGNAPAVVTNFGTISNVDLPFITNNVERMRIATTGNVGIGTSTFDATNPEKVVINAGTTTSVNALYLRGTINSYFQINIQNSSTGNQSSSNIVATANNGTETTNFVDLGINGSAFVYQAGNLITTGKANDGYLLSAGNDFYIVNNNASKDILFMTGGTASTNERVRILSTGNVGIAIAAPTSTLSINGSFALISVKTVTGNYTFLTTDSVVINTGPFATWTIPAANTCLGRIYRLLNHGTGSLNLSVSITLANGNTVNSISSTAKAPNFYTIISDGTVWRRI